MRVPIVLFLCASACASSAPAHRSVSPNALRGVTLALPSVEDARRSQSAGCGQFVPDLPEQIEKALYVDLADAGAHVERRAPWRLSVRLLFGGAGAEYVGPSRTPPGPEEATKEGFGPAFRESRGGINAGWSETTVSLDAELAKDGRVVWHGTATGIARSAPCVQLKTNLADALAKAVDELRDRVIREIDRAP
jgi:hypothetical protein